MRRAGGCRSIQFEANRSARLNPTFKRRGYGARQKARIKPRTPE